MQKDSARTYLSIKTLIEFETRASNLRAWCWVYNEVAMCCKSATDQSEKKASYIT